MSERLERPRSTDPAGVDWHEPRREGAFAAVCPPCGYRSVPFDLHSDALAAVRRHQSSLQHRGKMSELTDRRSLQSGTDSDQNEPLGA